MLDRVSNISCGKVQEAIAIQPSTAALNDYVAEAVKAEREACAKVCETVEVPIDIDVWMGTKKALTAATAIGLASAIRARSYKENGG